MRSANFLGLGTIKRPANMAESQKPMGEELVAEFARILPAGLLVVDSIGAALRRTLK